MSIRISHQLELFYETPISESVVEVRMAPRVDARQVTFDFKLEVEPNTKLFEYLDWQGNRVHHFSLRGAHTHVRMTASASVDVRASNAAVVVSRDHRTRNFTMPHGIVQYEPRLLQFAEKLGLSSTLEPHQAAARVINQLHELIQYKPARQSPSNIKSILDLGHGNASDCAHVATAVFRLADIPTRFVSGYLLRGETPATHSWVEILTPADGWVGIDPALRQMTGQSYVAVAAGRSHSEVLAYRTVSRAGGEPVVRECLWGASREVETNPWSMQLSNSSAFVTSARSAQVARRNEDPNSIAQQQLQSD